VTIALIGGALYLVESKDENAPPPDIPGVVLSIIGLFALVYGIIEAGFHGWTSTNVLTAFAIAAVFLVAFVWWENRVPNAMLPMSFFRSRSFTGANVMLTLFAFSMYGSMFFMSQYFQTVQDVPPFEAGLRIIPHAFTMTLAATLSPRVAARIGTKRAIALGALVASGGMFYMSQVFHVETPYYLIAIGQLILATGLGTAFSPATATVMNSVPLAKAGVGSAMNDTTRQLGGALGVAVLGTVATNTYLSGIASLRESLSELPPQFTQAISSSIQAAHIAVSDPQVTDALREMIVTTTNQAFVKGMNNAMLISSLVMLAAFFAVLVLLPSRIQPVELEGEEVVEVAVATPAGGD
jgi:hypothetical protein